MLITLFIKPDVFNGVHNQWRGNHESMSRSLVQCIRLFPPILVYKLYEQFVEKKDIALQFEIKQDKH